MNAGTILVVGEAIGDFIPRDAEGRVYEAVLGGSGFNAALALARCGACVAYAGPLSTDALGRRFRAVLAREGIDASLVRDSARPSAVAVVAPLGHDGVPEFGLYLESTAHAAIGALPATCPDGVMHLHAASFGATVAAGGEAALALMARACEAGASTSYDVNIRPTALPSRDLAKLLIERRIARADIVKASLDDLAWLHPDWPAEQVVAHWHGLGAGLVLITRGCEGASCHGRNGVITAAAPSVVVADTVGAGDTFIGGFLAVLAARGLLGRRLAKATQPDLSAALAFACKAAADSCTRPGCDPPRRDARTI